MINNISFLQQLMKKVATFVVRIFAHVTMKVSQASMIRKMKGYDRFIEGDAKTRQVASEP